MSRKTRMSLEAKLCILTAGTLIIILLGVGHFAMAQFREDLIREEVSAFDSIANSLAYISRSLVNGSDKELTKSISEQIKNARMDLSYVTIRDDKGNRLFSETKEAKANCIRSTDKEWWQTVRRVLGYGAISPENVYSVSIPVDIGAGRSGTFTAGFDLTRVKNTADNVQSKVLLWILAGLIFSIISAIILGRSLAGGLKSLIKGARAVAAGDFSYRVNIRTNDEISILSSAFNHMVKTLEDNQKQLIEQVNTDCLTGLYNHRYLQERIAEEINRASRYKRKLSLLMLDIDFFKTFNDDHGHPAGDSALRDLAQILLENIRETDIAVRYGGEEFAIILPETSCQEAQEIAERIRKAVKEYVFTGRDNEKVTLTVSLGTAEYPSHCTDRAGLIQAADVALYQAKALGRNRVSCYDAGGLGLPQADPYKLYVLLNAHDLSIIEALAEAVDAKLKFPAGHSKAVAQIASAAAERLGLSEPERTTIYIAALLRDIGQIAIPDSILAKAGELTEDEKTVVTTHPKLGHAIVQKAPHLSTMLPAIMHHHEHYDGSGYPTQIAGDDIPLSARIIAAADAYQAMITARPHRKQMTVFEAKQQLIMGSGTQFDPKVVTALLEVLEEMEKSRNKAA